MSHFASGESDRGERRDCLRRDHRHADEERQHAARDREQARHRVDVVDEHRVAEQRDGDRDHDQRDVRERTARSRPRGRVAPSRTAEIGGTRVARSAGKSPASTVTTMPDEQADEDRARTEKTRLSRRQPAAERVEERVETLREQHAECEAHERGDHADHERLEEDGDADLASGGAERAQRRELARPLRDGDRHRVEDHEGADEQRDAGEREQEVLDDLHELVDLGAVLARLLGAGADGHVAGDRVVDPIDQRLRDSPRRRPRPGSRRTSPCGRRGAAPSGCRRPRTWPCPASRRRRTGRARRP